MVLYEVVFVRCRLARLAALIGMWAPVACAAQSSPRPADDRASSTVTARVSPAVRAAETLFDRAVALHKSGRAEAALAAYNDFISRARASHLPVAAIVIAYRNMLLIYRQRNDTVRALAALKQICALKPDDAGSWGDLAELEADRRDYAAARAHAERSLQLHPGGASSSPAHYALGEIAISERDLPKAETEFAASVRLTPGNVGARFNHALALSALKRYREAFAELDVMRRMAPHMLQAPLLEAATRSQTQDINGALAAYDRALKISPHDRGAMLGRAMSLQRIGHVDDAISAYAADLDQYPHEVDARINLGLLYANQKNQRAAHQQLLLGQQELERTGSQDTRVLILLGQIEADLAIHNFSPAQRSAFVSQAVPHLQRATALDPKDTRPLYVLADLYRRIGRYDDAMAIYQQRITASPDEKQALYGMSDVYVMQTRRDDAIEVWRAYQRRHAEDPASYQVIARLQELGGRWADAAEENARLAALDPQDGNARLDEADDWLHAEKPDIAEPLYRAVLAYDPEARDRPAATHTADVSDRQGWRIAAWRGLSQIDEGRHQLDKAIADLENVRSEEAAQAKQVGKQPAHQVYLDIARLYKEEQKPDSALATLTTLTHVASDDPVGFAELGRLYEERGDTDAAVSALRKAFQRDKGSLNYALEGADLYRKHGKLVEAAGEYQALAEKYPGDVRILPPLAQTLETAGKYDQSLAVYRMLEKADPSLVWVVDREASLLTLLKRYDEARVIREQQIDRNPSDRQGYADLDHIYDLQGRSSGYQVWLERRAAQHPDDETLMLAVIDLYTKQKRAEEGWTYLHGLVEQHSKDIKTLKAYALVLQREGRNGDRIEVLKRLAALSPGDLKNQTDLVDALQDSGQKEEAFRLLRTLIARTDLSLDVREELRRQLAQRLEATGSPTEAIQVYREIVAVQPQDTDSLAALVRLLSAAERYNDIITVCSGLVKTAALEPSLRSQLLSYQGAAYEKQNRRAEALAQYREALRVNPNDAEASAAIKRLGGN